jgi:exonuclease SbcD
MRLLHTADLHLGKILHEQSLLEDQERALDQIAAELERGDYDLFIVAGDVFDRSVPPPEAIVLWDRFLGRIAASCPTLVTVVVSGNHDSAVRLSWSAGFLAAHRIHVRTRTEDLAVPVTLTAGGREWDIFAVPFLQAGALAGGVDEPALRSQQDLWKQALERLKASRRPGVGAILTAHLFAQGGSESDSERVFLGEAEQIPASWLADWDYVALGHLHRPQEPGPGVRYSGSPLAYSFSEAGQPKSLVRWEDGAAELLPLVPVHPLTKLEASYEELCTSPKYEAYRDHWLEVTLTDAALVSGPLERLRPRFPRLLSLRQAPAPAAAATALERRQTGDLAGDAVAFLSFLGQENADALRPRLVDAARTVTEEGA